jgi:hypothetical protein
MGSRLRLYAVNTFLALLLPLIVIDMLPQSPTGLRMVLQPPLNWSGLYQGPWYLFAPDPDNVNHRLLVEITYRDGEQVEWKGPEWRDENVWEAWWGFRRRQWHTHLLFQNSEEALRPWCRYLARTLRPDMPDADHGAQVRVIYYEFQIPAADEQPWTSWREPAEYKDALILTTEFL